MPLTAAEAEIAEWTDRRGDYWEREWTRTAGASTLTDLVVEIRYGDTEGDTLVASSVDARQGETVAAIDISGSDLSTGLINWKIEPAETLKLDTGSSYTIEFEVLRDGNPDTILRHWWGVDPQVAVRPEAP